MKKSLFLSILFVFLSLPIFSSPRGEQELVPSGHWVYDALESLKLEMARTAFTDQAPLSIQQIRTFMTDIDYESLSDSGKLQYDSILSYFKENSFSLDQGFLSIGVEMIITPELYFKPNYETYQIYDKYEKAAILEVPAKLNLGSYFTGCMDFSVRQNNTVMQNETQFTNQAFTYDTFDPYLTHTNYFSIGHVIDNVGFNLRFGSGTQSIGRSALESIILSDHLTDTPYINLSLYSTFFQYVCNITQLNSSTILYTHRFDLRLFKKITFSFLEGILPYSAFDLRFLTPMSIYHSFGLFEQYDLASYFAIKVDITPVKYLRLYVLYAQDEHQLSTEKAAGEGYIPEGLGFQAGIESYIPYNDGYFHIWTEFFYADPYLYIKDSPNFSFVKTSSGMGRDRDNMYEWIGSPFGPDSIAAKFSLGYEKIGKWSLNATYIFGALGEFADDSIFTNCGWNKENQNVNLANWIYPQNAEHKGATFTSPHGIPEYVNELYLTYSLQPVKFLSLKVQPGYVMIFNKGHKTNNFVQGFECAFSCKMYLNKLQSGKSISNFLLSDGKEK